MMKTAVFFGNGINRIDSNNPQWIELLENTFKYSHTPNTLRYEDCIVDKYRNGLSSKNQGSIEFKYKQEIARKFDNFSSNDIYRKFITFPIADFITTNYDHSFEQALVESGYELYDYDDSESRFSIHRFYCYKNENGDVKRIWHIHGDYKYPRSIMLGYEQYGGQLRKIGEYINGNYKLKGERICSIKERMIEPFSIKSWIDLFFNFNVHFIGFGLPYDEIDMWWLLCKRQKMMLQHPYLSVSNRIIYHTKKSDGKELERNHLLSTLSIECKAYEIDDYKSLYMRICNAINSTVIT